MFLERWREYSKKLKYGSTYRLKAIGESNFKKFILVI